MDTILGPPPPVADRPPTPAASPLNPANGYQLHPSVAVRPEPFGALVYHYGNRKLVFLKSPRLVKLVESLGTKRSIDVALDDVELVGPSRLKYLDALASLIRSDMLIERPAPPSPPAPSLQSTQPEVN